MGGWSCRKGRVGVKMGLGSGRSDMVKGVMWIGYVAQWAHNVETTSGFGWILVITS